jgi:nicotinamidase/pyrazinamidase
MLAGRGVRDLLVTGLATDYCVKETAIDGAHLGYAVTVRRELVRGVELRRGDSSRAFQAMRRARVTVE